MLKLKLKQKQPKLDTKEGQLAGVSSVGDRLNRTLDRHEYLTGLMTKASEQLAEVTKKLNSLELDILPNLLREAGADQWRSEVGVTVEMKETITANISTRNEKEANKILKRIGAGGIAKVAVAFEFAQEDKAALLDLLKYSKAHKVPCDQKTVVNTGSLKAAARKALADGKLQPEELPLLGIFATTRAKVKLPKSED